MSKIKVFTDGASRNNPEHAGIGIVIYNENDFNLHSFKEYIGETTNNQAEYRALIKGLELANKLKSNNELIFDSIEFYCDSELAVKQLNFEYQTKDPNLAVLNSKFHVLAKQLDLPYKIIHIDRSQNKNADKLANLAIDGKFKKTPGISLFPEEN